MTALQRLRFARLANGFTQLRFSLLPSGIISRLTVLTLGTIVYFVSAVKRLSFSGKSGMIVGPLTT